jgi:hypothetical protein
MTSKLTNALSDSVNATLVHGVSKQARCFQAELRARLESRSETSWDQYQIRHQRHRDELELGTEREVKTKRLTP